MIAVELVSHIRTDAQGQAWIDETNVKVIEVIKDWLAPPLQSPKRVSPLGDVRNPRPTAARNENTEVCWWNRGKSARRSD